MNALWIWLAVINPIAAVVTAADKRAAIRHRWRVPERTLLALALVGGAAGEWLAMLVCRHKTRKAKFYLGVPLMLAFHIALILYLVSSKEVGL